MKELEEDPGVEATEGVLVRDLRASDAAAIVKIDRASTGRVREEYYRAKVKAALAEPSLRTSLVAEIDGHVAGFLLAKVFYGEFGHAEPIAVIDSVGVDPQRRGKHVGQALLRQLVMNLNALHVERIETQVDWDQFDLLAFLAKNGFRPAPRVCLQCTLDAGARG
ncbi:MAG: GNAT family N-acetyltransferase [Planctomycetes bacterium]|nr:GNAT family N-acetyltransferase [Planctomycetota bacterium]